MKTPTPPVYKIKLETCDFVTAVLFMRELCRLMDAHEFDVHQQPFATVGITVMPTTEGGQTALESFLEETRLLMAPLSVSTS